MLVDAMLVSFAQRVSVPADVLFRELEGESVILHLESESYFGLDHVGTRMWQLLTESESIQTAYEALLEEYEVEPERLRADLTTLLETLSDRGLVDIRGG